MRRHQAASADVEHEQRKGSEPKYSDLSEEADRPAIIGGLRFAWRMFGAAALKQFVRKEKLPGSSDCPAHAQPMAVKLGRA